MWSRFSRLSNSSKLSFFAIGVLFLGGVGAVFLSMQQQQSQSNASFFPTIAFPTFPPFPGSHYPTNTPFPYYHPTPTPYSYPTNIPTLYYHPTSTPIPYYPTNTPVPTEIPTVILSTPTIAPTQGQVPTVTSAPTPTIALAPTSTPGVNDTLLGLDVFLHGIGNGGDNANPHGSGNMSPGHPSRTLSVDLYNSQNNLVATVQGNVIYDSSSGSFKGTVDLGGVLVSGAYTIKVKGDQYLRTQIPGIQNLISGQMNSLPQFVLITGDINNDNSVNILDYNILMGCYSDLLPATNCNSSDNVMADLTDDGAVNQFDYNLFLREVGNSTGQ